MSNRYNNVITIKGQRFLFHDSIKQTEIKTVEKQFNEKGYFNLFNKVYGRIQNPEEKSFRKILNALIRAKNNPINVNKTEIVVKLSDRNIKIKPLLFKD